MVSENVIAVDREPLNSEVHLLNNLREVGVQSTALLDNNRMEGNSKQILCKIIFDFILLAIPAITALILNLFATPFVRGFFCNDDSLIHPYRQDTITTLTIAVVGVITSVLLIVIVELIRSVRKLDAWDKSAVQLFNWKVPLFVQKLYQYLGILLFAFSVNQILTDMTKFAVGRYRPHFIDFCQPQLPDGSTCANMDNWHKYIQNFTCSNPDATGRPLTEMRLSFPSGHSSFAICATVFCVLYIQARLTWRGSKLLRHFIQLLFIAGGLYTCLSRISDYKHHWSDVFAGAALGFTIAYIFCVYMTDLFKPKLKKQNVSV